MPSPFLSATSYDQLMNDKGLLMLVVTITGLLVVFLALIILVIVFTIFGALSKKNNPAPITPPPAPTPTPKLSAAPSGIAPEIIAAISAAVAVTMDGQPFAIRSVRRTVSTGMRGRNAWSSAGVMDNTRPF